MCVARRPQNMQPKGGRFLGEGRDLQHEENPFW
jgi:hypothetical protein